VIATRHGPTATWTFAFGEGRGNRFFTDQNGAFVQDVEYKPYGEANSTGAQPGAPTYTSAQWNGGDALVALGLSQLGARIYDPVIGRFLSRDPLIIPRTAATTNPYIFAMNDPVNSSDRSGLDTFDDIGRKLCPECEDYENIYVDGGYWHPETEPHSRAGDGATGVGAFTYPESSNPVVPPFTPRRHGYWWDTPGNNEVDLYNECRGYNECFQKAAGEAIAQSMWANHEASIAAEMNHYAIREGLTRTGVMAEDAHEFMLAGKPNGGPARITVNQQTGVGMVNFIDPKGSEPEGHLVSAFNPGIVANKLPRGTLIGMAHGNWKLDGRLAPGITVGRFLRGMDRAAQEMQAAGIPVRFCVAMVCGGGKGNLLHNINTYFSPPLGTGGFTGVMTNYLRGVMTPESGNVPSTMIYLPPPPNP
jgi:RHS repeat-associated protein